MDTGTPEGKAIFGATYAHPDDLWLRVHFTPTAASQAAGRDYLKRMVDSIEQMSRVTVSANAIQSVHSAAPAPAPLAPGAIANSVTQETLGDLKLYRLAEPIRIAAKQQKFFEFVSFPSVEAELSYVVPFLLGATVENASAQLVWHLHDSRAKGLGKPLPRGPVTLYAAAGGAYLGDDLLQKDVAEGETFDVRGPRLGEVVFDHWLTSETRWGGQVERSHTLVLRNMLTVPAQVEVPPAAGTKITLAPHETRQISYKTTDRF